MNSTPQANKSQSVFVMMPFETSFDDVFSAVKDSIDSVDESMRVIRLDEVRSAGFITQDMVEQIRRSAVCLADVTGANPNVMWEVGFAAALGKPLIAINQQDSLLPFDIKDVRTLMYDRSSLSKTLREPLAKALQATLERYISRRSNLADEQQGIPLRAIAITGSSEVPQGLLKDRLERTLHPYIGQAYHWYVGGYGDTDETTLRYLLEVGESSITVVGYSSYDISEDQLSLLEQHPSVSFIDAAQEQMPTIAGAASERDMLFASRADLLVIMWNGASKGTKQLLDWLRNQKKDHVLAFVPTTFVAQRELDPKSVLLENFSRLEQLLFEAERNSSDPAPRYMPLSKIISRAAERGLISSSELPTLNEVIELRNSIAHGGRSSRLDIDRVSSAIAHIDQLISSIRGRLSKAQDNDPMS